MNFSHCVSNSHGLVASLLSSWWPCAKPMCRLLHGHDEKVYEGMYAMISNRVVNIATMMSNHRVIYLRASEM